jgi:hypothetical protein
MRADSTTEGMDGRMAYMQVLSGKAHTTNDFDAQFDSLFDSGVIVTGSTNTWFAWSNGLATVSFNIASGASYRVEATTNLLNGSDWTNITAQLTNQTGESLIFSDTSSTAYPLRVYRIASP